MTYDSVTSLKRMIFASVSMLSLTGCLPATPPDPPPKNEKAVEALCDSWLGSLASWADADTEQTKDEIDLSIRVQEAACLK